MSARIADGRQVVHSIPLRQQTQGTSSKVARRCSESASLTELKGGQPCRRGADSRSEPADGRSHRSWADDHGHHRKRSVIDGSVDRCGSPRPAPARA